MKNTTNEGDCVEFYHPVLTQLSRRNYPSEINKCCNHKEKVASIDLDTYLSSPGVGFCQISFLDDLHKITGLLSPDKPLVLEQV